MATKKLRARCLLCEYSNEFESNPDQLADLVIATQPCVECGAGVRVWVREYPELVAKQGRPEIRVNRGI